MANSATNIAVAAFVGAAVAVIAGVIGIERLAGGGVKKMVHAEINLDIVQSECVIQTSPQTLEVFKKEKIQWTIIDRCGITQSVDVAVVFSAANNPLDTACTTTGKKKITCSLKSDVESGLYKYSVTAGTGITEDPELEIVQ